MYVDQDWRHTVTHRAAAQIEGIHSILGSDAEVSIEAAQLSNAVKNCASALHADLLVIGRSLEQGSWAG